MKHTRCRRDGVRSRAISRAISRDLARLARLATCARGVSRLTFEPRRDRADRVGAREVVERAVGRVELAHERADLRRVQSTREQAAHIVADAVRVVYL